MDATFIGLLQSQISSLQESESNSDSNIIILETIKLLLRNVDLSSGTLSGYDKFGMRRLFAAYGEVGKQVCSFYDEGKPYLDPAALNGSIGKTLSATEEQIDATTAAFDEMSAKEADLLKKEDELRALDSKHKALQEKSAELRAIYETVSDVLIADIERDKANAEYELSAYDTIVKKIIVAEEAARDAIKKKQNKIV